MIEDNEDITKRKWKDHPIKLKTLYFETNDWTEHTPCTDHLNSPYSVENINKGVIAWLWTDNFRLFAGATMEEFIKTIQDNGGTIYTELKKGGE